MNMPGELFKGRVGAVLTPEWYLKVSQGGLAEQCHKK